MKKFVLVFVLLICFALTGCNSTYKEVSKNLSEVRYNIYVGETDTLKATFMCGKREKDYVINGYSSALIDFGIITVTLKKDLPHENAKVVLTVDTNRYEELLEENPFDGTLVCDLKLLTTSNDLTVKVFLNGKTEELKLQSVSSDWKITHVEALKLACKTLNNELKTHISDGYKGEVYVKIIEDTKVNKGNYYWYVSFANRDGIKHTVIIDPVSGEILAKN